MTAKFQMKMKQRMNSPSLKKEDLNPEAESGQRSDQHLTEQRFLSVGMIRIYPKIVVSESFQTEY